MLTLDLMKHIFKISFKFLFFTYTESLALSRTDILALSMFCSDASTCMMSEWITWSPCSVSCGTGTRSRERYVKQFPDDGSVCTLPTQENENCVVNEECCKVFFPAYLKILQHMGCNILF